MSETEVIFYSFPSCSSSRHVREWLKVNKIGYVERKVLREPIGKEEIQKMLELSKEGFDDIISEKNYTNGAGAENSMEDLLSSQLIHLIVENPSLLKKPVVILSDQLIVGWNKNKYREISMGRVMA